MEHCILCQKETDQCCSLCRKVFYCSNEHQEIDWFMKHKHQCEGRQHISQPPKQYPIKHHHEHQKSQVKQASMVKEQESNWESKEQALKVFIEMFQQRLLVRKKIAIKLSHLNQDNTTLKGKDIIIECKTLITLSEKLTSSYSLELKAPLQISYGVVTDSFTMDLDCTLDKVLLARCLSMFSTNKQLKELLIIISNLIQNYPPDRADDQILADSYSRMLTSVIDLGELVNFDAVVEKMYGFYIKLVELRQGIWEQVYSYYHFGIWYYQKTYCQKATLCFSHSLELLSSSKTNKESDSNVFILKGDILFNLAQCNRLTRNQPQAIENMLESYRLRSQAVGKNSIEGSNCLYVLAEWAFEAQQFEKCQNFVEQCYRIRKLNPSFDEQLEKVKSLINKLYDVIHKEKQTLEKSLNPKNAKYFDGLLEERLEESQSDEEKKKEPFSKRLFQDQRDEVSFKVVISPEMANTLSSEQWTKLMPLIDLTDKVILKEEAIKLILESQFTFCLSEDQKSLFIKQNKIL